MNRFLTAPVRRSAAAAGLTALLALGACATKEPPPVAEMATARTALDTAQSAGALQAAPTEFLAARDKLTRAELASKEKNHADARRFASEAAVDAEVAERKARAARAAAAAQELQRANGVLSNELGRDKQPS